MTGRERLWIPRWILQWLAYAPSWRVYAESESQRRLLESAMKITGRVEVETVIDVVCDVCCCSTRLDKGGQFGTLQAHWGYGNAHDGERYEVHLCEDCFFQTLAYLKQERRTQHLFSEDGPDLTNNLGLVAKDD